MSNYLLKCYISEYKGVLMTFQEILIKYLKDQTVILPNPYIVGQGFRGFVCFLLFFFYFSKKIHTFIYLVFNKFKGVPCAASAAIKKKKRKKCLHTDSMSSILSRKVVLEFGRNQATVSVSTSQLSPGSSGFVQFATRSHCSLLCTHEHISCPNRIPFHLGHKHLLF